jgi:hypothetical protein
MRPPPRSFLALVGALLLIPLCWCARLTIGNNPVGPFTTKQALDANWGLPIYTVDPSADNSLHFKLVHFLIDRDDLFVIETYFLNNSHRPATNDATMYMNTLLKGGPPDLLGYVTINWAIDKHGYTCKLASTINNRKPIPPSTYKTCLHWMDNEHKNYVFYSVWAENETVQFVNSLIRAN